MNILNMTHKYCIGEVTLPSGLTEICILTDWEYELIASKCKVLYETNSKREVKKEIEKYH